MKKSIRSVALLGVCALSLTACGEVSFADFKTAAETAIKKDVEYKTAKVTGSITTKSDSGESKNNIDLSLTVSGRVITSSLTDIKGIAYGAILSAQIPTLFTGSENTSYKYYNLGVSYEAKNDDGDTVSYEYKWDSVGMITKYVGYTTVSGTKGKINLSISYSK